MGSENKTVFIGVCQRSPQNAKDAFRSGAENTTFIGACP